MGKPRYLRECTTVAQLRDLVDAGAEVEGQDGVDALINGLFYNRDECVRALIEAGADVNRKGHFDPETPLLVAIEAGNYESMDMLLEAGADVNLSNSRSVTPLIHAAYCDWYEVVKRLIVAGADVNSVDNNGRTALVAATKLKYIRPHIGKLEINRIKIIKLLLQVQYNCARCIGNCKVYSRGSAHLQHNLITISISLVLNCRNKNHFFMQGIFEWSDKLFVLLFIGRGKN